MEDKARKVVDDLENAEDNPVSEPLCFLLCVTGIECQEWLENGVCNSEQASNVGLANAKHDSQAQDSETVGRNLLGLQAGHAFYLLNVFHGVLDYVFLSKLVINWL